MKYKDIMSQKVLILLPESSPNFGGTVLKDFHPGEISFIQGTNTYPATREHGKIIDSKVPAGKGYVIVSRRVRDSPIVDIS